MRVVSPYRPFPAESASHCKLGAFDWIAALRMLSDSVLASCGCATIALTDTATPLPVPSFPYPTMQARLMLWILEVSLAYLQSPDFDRDTVFVSPDTIVSGDLRPYFEGDLTVLVRSREKYHNRPLLNSVQWWPIASKDRLIGFYRAAMDVAARLPENAIVWGADAEALRRLVEPIDVGLHRREGLRVSMREASSVLLSISTSLMTAIDQGRRLPAPLVPIMDFKGPIRKRYMAPYVAATQPQPVTR